MEIDMDIIKSWSYSLWNAIEDNLVPHLKNFEKYNTLSDRDREVVTEGIILMIGIIVIHLLIYVFLKLRYDLKDPFSMTDNIFCVPFTAWLSYLAVTASHECMGDLEQRWFAYSWKMKAFLWSYVIRSIFHIPYMFLCEMKPTTRILMCFHHIISAVSYFGGVYYHHMACYGALDGVCEISTFFLSVLFLLKDSKMDQSIAYTVSGVSLFLSYIFFRLVLFPYWLLMFYRDVTEHQELTWDKVGPIQRYIYPVTNVILLVLSTIWMVPITKGMLKALRPKPKEKVR